MPLFCCPLNSLRVTWVNTLTAQTLADAMPDDHSFLIFYGMAMAADSRFSRRNAKGWFPKGWFWRLFPRNENRNEGTFGCSPGTKNRNEGTCACSPPERKPERGYIRQNHPFTKPPCCLPVILFMKERRSSFELELKIILTTPTPHICKKYAPEICHTMGVCMA